MKDYTALSNEELVAMIRNGDEQAYGQLFLNIKPAIFKAAQKYIDIITIFTLDDFIQEGNILAWQIVEGGKFREDNFFRYFYSSLGHRFAGLARDYILKHPMRVKATAEAPEMGCQVSVLEEIPYVAAYREKHKQECRNYYRRRKEKEAEERRAAGIPDPVKLTEEEKKDKKRAQCLDYYHKNREELNRKKREKRRAAKLAASGQGI